MENVLVKVDCYMLLVPCNESTAWEDMLAYGYEDLGNCYTFATAEDGDNVYAEDVEIDYLARTNIVSDVGGMDGDYMCSNKKWTVIVDKAGKVWMEVGDFEDAFC